MTREEIRDWLDLIGKNRDWLAEKCGATKYTVNTWFSTRGFPKPALKMIERLMKEEGPNADLSQIHFTLEEYKRIEEAVRLTCYPSNKEFYRDAILDKAETELARIQRQEAARRQQLSQVPRAAEDTVPYRTAAERAAAPRPLTDEEIRQQMEDDNATN